MKTDKISNGKLIMSEETSDEQLQRRNNMRILKAISERPELAPLKEVKISADASRMLIKYIDIMQKVDVALLNNPPGSDNRDAVLTARNELRNFAGGISMLKFSTTEDKKIVTLLYDAALNRASGIDRLFFPDYLETIQPKSEVLQSQPYAEKQFKPRKRHQYCIVQ